MSHRAAIVSAFAMTAAVLCPLSLAAAPAHQAQLKVAREAFERPQNVQAELQLPEAIDTKDATISYEVTDSFGRLLVRKTEAVPAASDTTGTIKIDLPVPNIVVMRHYLGVTVQDAKGQVWFAQTPVVYKPPAGWLDYSVVLYQKHPANRLPFLRQAYVDGNLWYGSNPSVPEYMVDANIRWHVDNVAVPIFSPYHRWYADGRSVGWLFEKARARFLADRDLLNLQRSPCLSQEPIKELIERCAMTNARSMAAYRPLWYSLADETGIGNQAAESGFCFTPECREAFRDWLKARYKELSVLNQEWGTDYAKWEAVRGWTADEIFARKGDNFAPWCDHTDFMDDVLMNAYAVGVKKIQEFDPGAFVGIGGGQGPVAVGGWDFWKLTHTLNCMEPYYIGNNVELIRSFNPQFHTISMTGGGDNDSKRHRWHLFLHGDHAALMWDDKTSFVDDQGKFDEQGRESAKWHKELTAGLARQYMLAPRIDDPIAVYESQASMRVHWAVHVRAKGSDWAKRGSRDERVDNLSQRERETWLKILEDAGLQYRMLAPQQVLAGDLKLYDAKTGQGFKILILPRILALSGPEADAIRQFAQSGGTVIADGLTGLFDEHGKRLPAGQLDELFGIRRPAGYRMAELGTEPSGLEGLKMMESGIDAAGAAPAHAAAPKCVLERHVGKGLAIYLNVDLIDYHRLRLHAGEEKAIRDLVNPMLYQQLGKDRRAPLVTTADGQVPLGVETVVKDLGGPRIVALMRNPQTMISELGPVEYQSNEGFEKPAEVKLDANLPGQDETFVYYDMRAGKKLAQGKSLTLTVQPYEPVMLSVWSKDPGTFTVQAPSAIAQGSPLDIEVKPGSAQASQYVYHIDVTGPDGKPRLDYRMNFTFGPEGGRIHVPLALNDPSGAWTISIREAATGVTQEAKVQVE
jgi:hypothetical protein